MPQFLFFLHWCFNLNKFLHLYTYDRAVCLCTCIFTRIPTEFLFQLCLALTGFVNELSEAVSSPEKCGYDNAHLLGCLRLNGILFTKSLGQCLAPC